MKRNKNIIAGIFVFAFTFISLFLALDNRQETYAATQMDSRFKDYKFYLCVKAALGASGVSSDGYTLKTSALENLKTLQCKNKSISDATGLSSMKNLEELSLYNNKLTSIDLSKNTNLKDIELTYNKLTSINVINNKKLEYLTLDGNKITSINLKNNTKLEGLYISSNKLTSIYLDKNTELRYLIANSNKLTSINLQKNAKLEDVRLSYNMLTKIYLSSNPTIHNLELQNNNFSSIPSECSSVNVNCRFGYIITYKSNGGSIVSKQNGYTLYKPTDPTKSGYNFAGWYKDSKLTSPVTFPFSPNKNMILYAKWTTQLAQEEEIISSFNGRYTMKVIAVIALFLSICFGLLSYSSFKIRQIEPKKKK